MDSATSTDLDVVVADLMSCHRLAFSQGNQLLVRLRSQQHLFVIECRVIPIFRVYDILVV